MQKLIWFWNACNGYDFDLHINDRNILKAHKNESQKLIFDADVQKRFGMAA